MNIECVGYQDCYLKNSFFSIEVYFWATLCFKEQFIWQFQVQGRTFLTFVLTSKNTFLSWRHQFYVIHDDVMVLRYQDLFWLVEWRNTFDQSEVTLMIKYLRDFIHSALVIRLKLTLYVHEYYCIYLCINLRW